MLVNHLVLNLKTFSRRGCASDAAFSDAQYAENKFLGHIGAPLGGMDGDMSPHAHEAWSELTEDGHDTEEGHTESLPTWPSDMVRYTICCRSWTSLKYDLFTAQNHKGVLWRSA